MTLTSTATGGAVLVAFSTRVDGDLALAQSANRARFYQRLGVDPSHVVAAEQVHGANVARVGRADRGRVVPETDALIADEPEVYLALVFADCVPIVLHDPVRRAVAAVHAGWRGTAARIAARAVAEMRASFGSDPADLRATFGPAIGQCCYEVSADVAEAVQATVPDAVVVAAGPRGRPLLDLPAANRAQLLTAGLVPRHLAWRVCCTSCQVDRYFSHRAEAGQAARMAALVGLRGEGET